MANYRRPKQRGQRVFFTVCLAERGSDLLIREIWRLRDAVRETRMERPFGIDAWVVLPDHLHAVWTMPEGDRDLGLRWGAIKARFSRGLPLAPRRPSHGARRERGIWQRRFWEHHIRDRADYVDHLEYCWTDPVRHGLVAQAEDWPFSSVHAALSRGLCNRDALRRVRFSAPPRWGAGEAQVRSSAPYILRRHQ